MTEHDRTADPAAPAHSEPVADPVDHRPETAAPRQEEQTPAEHDSAAPVLSAVPAHEPAEPAGATAAPTSAATPHERIVYVPAPQPPRTRGSRGFGIGVALASSLVFTIVYALLAALFIGIGGPTALAERVQVFAQTPSFWMPVIAFTLGYVLLVVIVNRAGWWAHVLGGFLVAALVYGVFILSTVLSAQAVGAAPQQLQQFLLLQVTNPLGWAAAIAAREVPIWVGGLVARHGRAAKAHNAAAREEYLRDRDEAHEAGAAPAV